jgi:hypothetical protein
MQQRGGEAPGPALPLVPEAASLGVGLVPCRQPAIQRRLPASRGSPI